MEPATKSKSVGKGKAVKMFTDYDKSKEKLLPRQFFRQEVVELAKQLLGKVIVRELPDGVIRAVIVETEAYKAPHDKACHAYDSNLSSKVDKKTERTKYFWLDGGSLYIYTIYMPTNICLNVVAGSEGEPEAVLLRAVQIIEGEDLVWKMRKIKSNKSEDLTNGPGKIGQALGIDKDKMNGIDLLTGNCRVVDGGIKDFEMGVSKRINIDYAGEWVDREWRFFIKNNSYVSKPPAPKSEKAGQDEKKTKADSKPAKGKSKDAKSLSKPSD